MAVVSGSQCANTAPSTAGVDYVIATSTGDPTGWGVARVVIRQVTLRLTPRLILLGFGRPVRFEATIEGSENEAVAWSIVDGAGATYGTIGADGVSRAPKAAVEVTVHVRATSAADPMG